MKLVVIESPYAGDVEGNIWYLHECLLDCIKRGEAPYASHQMYTVVLDDGDLLDRIIGMQCGFAWMAKADLVAVYTDLGISPGMIQGIKTARELGIPVEHRKCR